MNLDTWNMSVAVPRVDQYFSVLVLPTEKCWSAGYPGDYSTDKSITGINEAERLDGVMVFHAGTKINAGGEIETAAGRMFGVTACAATLEEATTRAYEAVSKIQFDGMQFRHDIGAAH